MVKYLEHVQKCFDYLQKVTDLLTRSRHCRLVKIDEVFSGLLGERIAKLLLQF